MIVVAGLLAIAFAFVASNVAANHQPEPHNLPVGIVGSPQVADPVAGRLEAKISYVPRPSNSS